jgi:class 3 adenylate cyclase
MPFRELHYRWQWRLRSSPRDLWPLVADTNRFNRDTGVPPVERPPGASGELPNARRRLRLFRLGIPVEWEEDPFEWVWPRRFGVVRRYVGGPVAELRVLVELAPEADLGTRLVYQVWARPRDLLGRVAIPVEIGFRARRRFEAAVRRYDALVSAGGSPPLSPSPVPLAPGAAARLPALAETLRRAGAPPDLLARLIETIERADDLALTRLRPYALADHWGAPRRTVLELCLLATRAGLLDFRWDLLCPLCRGAKASAGSLREVSANVHCESCRIDFTVDFDRLVELTFRPNPAIRPVEAREFCLGGPRVTPHVVAQQLVPPGGARAVTLALETGRYRLRTLGPGAGQLLEVGTAGAPAVTLRASPDGWPTGEALVGPAATVTIENATGAEQLFVLERLAWTDQAVTAAEVTTLQVFRDLFAREALRPHERISVGSVALLFTDLLGSTRLYRDIGDAPAFGRVMSHFDILREAVAGEGGAVIKTMGDAVMAAFGRPAPALRAVIAAQRALAEAGTEPRLRLKAGLHVGPCIAVTLNGQLDYFGSTVNVAARLQGLARGGDVVVSSAVRADPEVEALLAESGSPPAEGFEATLRGFEAQPFAVWRITVGSQAG